MAKLLNSDIHKNILRYFTYYYLSLHHHLVCCVANAASSVCCVANATIKKIK